MGRKIKEIKNQIKPLIVIKQAPAVEKNEFVFDVRRTLRDTIFLVLMRLMTSSWIQEEIEYPLMRTISSPTYKSKQDVRILGITHSLFDPSCQLTDEVIDSRADQSIDLHGSIYICSILFHQGDALS